MILGLRIAVTALAVGGGLGLQTARVQPTVAIGAPGADGTVTITVRVVPSGVVLGSYQGTLRFLPGALRGIHAAAPRGGDATRMINAADSTTGVIRYAGFTVTGFRHDTVLILRARPGASFATADLVAALDVAADSAGTRIPRERLFSSVPARPRP